MLLGIDDILVSISLNRSKNRTLLTEECLERWIFVSIIHKSSIRQYTRMIYWIHVRIRTLCYRFIFIMSICLATWIVEISTAIGMEHPRRGEHLIGIPLLKNLFRNSKQYDECPLSQSDVTCPIWEKAGLHDVFFYFFLCHETCSGCSFGTATRRWW